MLTQIYYWLGFFWQIFFCTMAFGFLMAMLFVRRKFDKIFGKTPVIPFDPQSILVSPLLRCTTYMMFVVLKKPPKRTAVSKEYLDYDYYGNTNLFDRIICWLGIIGLAGCAPLSIIWMLVGLMVHQT